MTLSISTASQQIKAKAQELKFDLVGITPAHPPHDFSFFQDWLHQGYSGQMAYLEKGAQKRKDPSLILEGVQSVICCALNYFTEEKNPQSDSTSGKISSYAWGKDYHKVVLEKLEALEKFIHEKIAPHAKTKSYVDTGAILERSYAQKAGLGWIGKNTMLINPEQGSWFFLGEILTSLKLAYDTPFQADHCGTCTRCLEACPTNALKEEHVLDATACISYLTLEHRGSIAPEKRPWLGNHLVGCDICQEVCPWNRDPIVTSVQDFFPKEGLNEKGPGILSLEEISKFKPEDFQKFFFESPLKRLKYEGLLRNAVIAMGNSGNTQFIQTLETMKSRVQNSMIEEHIDWAIEKLNHLI